MLFELYILITEMLMSVLGLLLNLVEYTISLSVPIQHQIHNVS